MALLPYHPQSGDKFHSSPDVDLIDPTYEQLLIAARTVHFDEYDACLRTRRLQVSELSPITYTLLYDIHPSGQFSWFSARADPVDPPRTNDWNGNVRFIFDLQKFLTVYRDVNVFSIDCTYFCKTSASRVLLTRRSSYFGFKQLNPATLRTCDPLLLKGDQLHFASSHIRKDTKIRQEHQVHILIDLQTIPPELMFSICLRFAVNHSWANRKNDVGYITHQCRKYNTYIKQDCPFAWTCQTTARLMALAEQSVQNLSLLDGALGGLILFGGASGGLIPQAGALGGLIPLGASGDLIPQAGASGGLIPQAGASGGFMQDFGNIVINMRKLTLSHADEELKINKRVLGLVEHFLHNTEPTHISLSEMNLFEIETPADGHCLFHAVSYSWKNQINSDPGLSYKYILGIAIKEVLSNIEKYQSLLNNQCTERNVQSGNIVMMLTEYAINKLHQNELRDIVPKMISNALNVAIFIIKQTTNKKLNLVSFPPDNEISKDSNKVFVYFQNNHYSGIGIKESTFNGTIQDLPEKKMKCLNSNRFSQLSCEPDTHIFDDKSSSSADDVTDQETE